MFSIMVLQLYQYTLLGASDPNSPGCRCSGTFAGMASNPLLSRLANLVARVVLRRVDDSKKMQLVQLSALAGETRADVERVQQYGFTSVPLEGAEGVAVFVGGYREHGFVVATDDRRHRLSGLQAGEVAIYTDQGDKVVIERGGTIRVTASTKVVVAAPLVELAGNAEAAVKGTTYRAAEGTKHGTEGAQLTAAGAALTSAGTDPVLALLAPTAAGFVAAAGASLSAAGAAIATFEASAGTFLSTKVKLS